MVDPLTGPSDLVDEESALAWIGEFVQSRSAIVLPAEKAYLLRARLEPLVAERGLGDLVELARALAEGTDGGLASAVVESMTTNETSFFRDRHPFEALAEVLPALIAARSATRVLRVWSAGCSTGQELYSVAILLAERFPELDSWRVELVGTDLSEQVVARAREGVFSALEINRGLSALQVATHFRRDGAGYRIDDRLRARTRFLPLNFVGAWPDLGMFDVILCRNVLIYFADGVRVRVLRGLRDRLAPDGVLVLGGAETTLGEAAGLSRSVVGRTTMFGKEAG